MTWDNFFDEIKKTSYYKKLSSFINQEYKEKTCYPMYYDMMKAFHLTPYDKIKCVIIGQDPYHTKGYANGLAFSVPNDIKISPSLANIFKELYDDLGIKRTNSDLSDWAKEGVLLLNASLSVIEGHPGSHMPYWEEFTDEVIKYIEQNNNKIVYILWGNFARGKKKLITNKNHFVIESAHPSPLGAYKGFFGSKPFSKCNSLLGEEINWGNNYVIKKGTNNIILSAPHCVLHLREGLIKPAEEETKRLALVLQEKTNCHVIYKTDMDQEDPNYDEISQYKKKLCSYIKENNITYLFDFHQMKKEREEEISIGIARGKNILNKVEIAYMMQDIFKKYELGDILIDEPFSGGYVNTVSSTVSRECMIVCVQLEFNSRILLDERFGKVVLALSEIIKAV